jgi:hypothetical protein
VCHSHNKDARKESGKGTGDVVQNQWKLNSHLSALSLCICNYL